MKKLLLIPALFAIFSFPGFGAEKEVREGKREKTTKEERSYNDKVKKEYKEYSGNESEKKEYATESERNRVEEQKKADLEEFKQKSKESLESIKELFQKAELAWKEKKYSTANSYYQSVSLSTSIGSEEMVETSRSRVVEMEDMAKELLKAADDADIQRDFEKEVNTLSLIIKNFGLTSSRSVAERRLINLKTKPDIAASVEYALAEELESNGKMTEAIEKYNAIIKNPRYEHSIVVLKTNRKLEELAKNEMVNKKIKDEFELKAEKEAPKMLSSAKNYADNNMPKKAIEVLKSVIEQFNGTQYAKDAEKMIKSIE